MSSSFENLSGLAIGGPPLPGAAGAPGAGLPWLPARWFRYGLPPWEKGVPSLLSPALGVGCPAPGAAGGLAVAPEPAPCLAMDAQVRGSLETGAGGEDSSTSASDAEAASASGCSGDFQTGTIIG